jgi:DNA (cytosine-5)-methyltransferase 1
MKDDYRNYLFEGFVKVVKEFRPDVFVFENVPGILSAIPGGKLVIERIYKAFDDIGYEIRTPELLKESVYSAFEFGVPQKRNRVIIIGIDKTKKVNLEDIYLELNSQIKNYETKNVEDAIKHLPKFKPLDQPQKINKKNVSHTLIGSENVKYHEARYHNLRDIKIFKDWINKKMNKSSTNEKITFYNDLMNKNSKHAKYRNLEWKQPSPTIVSHLYKDGLMFIHPDINQARSITVKEAAILQSFPDDFEFEGGQSYAFKMIGNAVPPQMAKIIAISIYNKIKANNE